MIILIALTVFGILCVLTIWFVMSINDLRRTVESVDAKLQTVIEIISREK